MITRVILKIMLLIWSLKCLYPNLPGRDKTPIWFMYITNAVQLLMVGWESKHDIYTMYIYFNIVHILYIHTPPKNIAFPVKVPLILSRLLTPRWTCQYFSLPEKLSEKLQSTFWGEGSIIYNFKREVVIAFLASCRPEDI